MRERPTYARGAIGARRDPVADMRIMRRFALGYLALPAALWALFPALRS